MSFVLRPGEGDEPIYSNFYFAFHVESAEEYFKNYRESMDVWNEIASKAQGQRAFSYEITDETIADKPGLLITMDLAAAMQAQGVPQAEEMFKKMFGEDGKMRAYVAQVDENRVLVSYAAKPAVETLIESLRESTEGLASDAGVAATAKLLPSDAPFAMYVSPQGCVAWFRRMMNVMLAAFGGGGPVIPDFPETPPVGIATAINGRVLATDVVVPNDMLQGLSQYIKQNQ
jgi:hypothetical protein